MLIFLLAACIQLPDDAKDTGGDDPVDTAGDTDDGTTECLPGVVYADGDADGFGSEAHWICEGDPVPAGMVTSGGDCDDADAAVNPDAAEVCDGVDQDCDGAVDDGLTVMEGFPDADGDGYGDADGYTAACDLGEGYVADGTDCDDADAAVNPAALESCNDYDDDCDGLVDDADSPLYGAVGWYEDADGDGYGNADVLVSACEAPAGYGAGADDCDDANPDAYPGAPEVCLNLVDEDCDGYTDDYTGDCDGSTSGGDDEVDLCDPAAVPIDVSWCASGVAAVLSSGAAYTTVQDALDDAVAGDIVTVCPGTWSESLRVGASPVSIVGYGEGVSVLTASGPILDGGTGNTITVVDLSMEGGAARGSSGGAIAASNTTLCIARAGFALNEAENGGAIYVAGTGSITVDASTFYGNTAGYAAGALYVEEGYTLLIEDSIFELNYAGYEAGAVEVDGDVTGTIADTTFLDNAADYEGGALEYAGRGVGGVLSLDRVTFEGNHAGYEGGALSIGAWDPPTVVATQSVFRGNSADNEGGAVSIGSWGNATFRAVLTEFYGNDSHAGGAIDVGGWGDNTAELEACILDGNTADYGAAIYARARGVETVNILDSTITSNVATGSLGGAGIDTDGTLTSTNTDWGSGGTDNSPDDVNGYTYGAGATFTCIGGVCF